MTDAPPPPPVQASAAGTAPAPVTGEEKTMGMLCHLLGFFGFLGPLIIWLIKKDTMPFVDSQGKEAINFHITVLIAFIVAIMSVFVLIGFILAPLVLVADWIFIIMATVTANNGLPYRYPICIRFIK